MLLLNYSPCSKGMVINCNFSNHLQIFTMDTDNATKFTFPQVVVIHLEQNYLKAC